MASASCLASPMGPREELILETFFSKLGQLAFDKAKEMMDKEKEAHKAFTTASWGALVQCLSQFVMAEKMYLSLSFLEQKRFHAIGRSKDNLRTMHLLLMQEYQRMSDSAPSSPTSRHSSPSASLPSPSLSSAEFEILLSHLCGQLYHFLAARQKMVDFYEQVSNLGAHRHMNFEDLSTMVNHILQAHGKEFHHPLLSPLRSYFNWECDVLSHLLQAQILMSEWQFLPSLLQLHSAHSKLQEWRNAANVKESKKPFASGPKISTMPALFLWLAKFKGFLVSKFSVYFYATLSKHSTPNDMKMWLSKAPEDYFSKIVTFQKRSDAYNISLVLDTNGLKNARTGNGYHHPDRPVEIPQGMDSYPAILTYPNEQPMGHWPNVLMLITPTCLAEKCSYFFDSKALSTYFIVKIDPRIYLVVIFETKKSEKDSYINSFLTDFSAQLRGHWILGSLKSPLK
ncbi:hypothetical protein C0Q70_07554 [Pomacea canaliculata]|uniref:KICSTOR subunit 2 n=1 Tax=Pomacea canaliculata TaxID=400727 RepID=A0A2T7PFC5_POMCA|nr:KICSTOR complex protein C12orf66 homolog [Pomacea canaliculata]PVD32126.1 hypothetical protein C0Q70_07554 [Pomacea canaliculata]